MTRSIVGLALAALLAACSSKPLEAPPATVSVPPAAAVSGVTLQAIPTGTILSNAGLAYEGGKGSDQRDFVVGAILVTHPKGRLLFDAGFGRSLDEHAKTTPLLLRLTSRRQAGTPAAEQLARAGIATSDLTAVVLTHAHWDHVSGLEHFKGVPVWLPRSEMAFVQGGERHSRLARQLGTADYQPYDFTDGPYFGFPASRDLFGDGSVVLVPAFGHTPGSIIAFVTVGSGQRYALIGDTAWQSEGVDLPAQKPWPARSVDADAAAVRALLVRLHQIKRASPGLVVVPAHDARVWKRLPQLGDQGAVR
ncbi:MAG TPA: MBL fold metallo-hydrolase [Caulobacter sp.]|nr:MBL fold metallo-hydrolase [Caulobacter sp.]